MAFKFKVGDRVLLDDKHAGVLKWHGQLEESEGDRYGIDLEAEGIQGTGDGTWKGKTLFTCQHGHGIFVSGDRITHDNVKTAAALRIQSLFRGRQVRQQSGLMAMQKTWTLLEDHDELQTTGMTGPNTKQWKNSLINWNNSCKSEQQRRLSTGRQSEIVLKSKRIASRSQRASLVSVSRFCSLLT